MTAQPNGRTREDLTPLDLDTWGNGPMPDEFPEDTSPFGPAGGFPADWRLLDDVQ